MLAGLQTIKDNAAAACDCPKRVYGPLSKRQPPSMTRANRDSLYPPPPGMDTETPEKKSPDWGTPLLWLVAGAAMFGLILWLYVYLTLRP